MTAHERHLFFAPSRDEVERAAARSDSDKHLPAQLLALKPYQRMGCFPKLDEMPETVVDFVRRTVDLPEGTPHRVANRTAERQSPVSTTCRPLRSRYRPALPRHRARHHITQSSSDLGRSRCSSPSSAVRRCHRVRSPHRIINNKGESHAGSKGWKLRRGATKGNEGFVAGRAPCLIPLPQPFTEHCQGRGVGGSARIVPFCCIAATDDQADQRSDQRSLPYQISIYGPAQYAGISA
ncbi:hypothetical protein [Streptomyces sp. NPDC013457]|uniref:hypothetical protein n=1 Tax=Streptomyces sp. NPDC013457 TaxID=3364866 RepID=UPI0036FE700E